MQPANTSREEMFGRDATLWPFLTRFGGPADPLEPVADTRVFETYPVLAMIALLWTLPDIRPAGRLPKYNPACRQTFSISDWKYVCKKASGAFTGISDLPAPDGPFIHPKAAQRTKLLFVTASSRFRGRQLSPWRWCADSARWASSGRHVDHRDRRRVMISL